MKAILYTSLSVIMAFIILSVLPVHGEEEIYDDLVRLHVIANSDSEEDQTLKLQVRDSIIAAMTDTMNSAHSAEDAAALINASLDEIEETARAAVAEAGYSYDVSAVIGKETYPRRQYGEISLPAGEYTSLRVIIGEGEGHNWWCVLFPPICTAAAMGDGASEEDYISAGLTGDQYALIKNDSAPKYKVRFKLLEMISDALDRGKEAAK